MDPGGECEDFFQNIPVPEHFAETSTKLSSFVHRHNECGRKIVLVTSGGTTVPLESRTVRFIDNFSVGTRGFFLKKDYAVIFLHRLRSLEPFSRRLHNVIDALTVASDGSVRVKEEFTPLFAKTLQQYETIKQNGLLLKITFTSLHDYLHLLRACAQSLKAIGPRAMIYLAAAVSDFHIPRNQMPEHKIQSSDGPLQLSLELVPKMLKPLVKMWVPRAFIISFKLETDGKILIDRARKALSSYNHQFVVANVLDKRKTEVVLVTMTTEEPIILSLKEQSEGCEIEEKIVSRVAHHHSTFCEQSDS